MTPNLLNLLSPNNIIVYMLVFSRLTGLLQTAPFFSTIRTPIMVKVWFCATLAFLIYPIVLSKKIFILPHDMPQFSILILIEFFIGFLIGFLSNLFLEGIGMCGKILSIQSGLSMSEALDPVTGVNSSELSRLYIYIATLIFISTSAYQMVFTSVFNGFEAFPIGALPFFDGKVVDIIIKFTSQMFVIAFGLALPLFSVLFICDFLLGIMSKMMPQMNIYMVALPVKIYIGLILLFVFLNSIIVYLQGVIGKFMYAVNALFSV